MSELFLLSEAQMARISPHFPLAHGVPRVDDRRVVSGIIYVIRNGLQWKDAPTGYGPHKTLYNRFVPWSRLGVFSRIFQSLAAEGPRPERVMIDSTQFAVHAKALPGKPYDGHTLETILPDIERLTGAALERILADAGYKGHNARLSHKFKVFTAGQKRRVTPSIKRQMKRRAAVEPVIGHIKSGHRMNRNYLAHTQGDAINPILATAGYNFRLILKWIRVLWLHLCWALMFNQSAKIV